MGKYTHLVGRVPKLQEDAPYQQRIETRRAELTNPDQPAALDASDPAALARAYAVARRRITDINAQLSDANLTSAAIEQLIIACYESKGTSFVKLDDGSSVGTQVEPYAAVIDRDANRAWAIANGLGNMLVLPWQTVNAQVKSLLEAGELELETDPDTGALTAPALGVGVYLRDKVVLRQPPKKATGVPREGASLAKLGINVNPYI